MKNFIKLFIGIIIIVKFNSPLICQDTIPPVAKCFEGVANITSLGNFGYFVLPATYFDQESFDNISSHDDLRFSFSTNINETSKAFCDNEMEETTIYVWDEANNYSTCTAKIRIDQKVVIDLCCECYGDSIPPTIVCRDFEAEINSNKNYNLNTGIFVDTAYDNIKLSPHSYIETKTLGCSNLGENIFQISVVDGNGNSNSCHAKLTLTDPNNYCATSSIKRNDTDISLNIQPNPATTEVTIDNAQQFQSIRLINLNGEVISQFNSPGKNLKIDTSMLVDGIFFFQGINENKKTVNKRLVILN